MPASDGSKAGKLQSARDELDAIQTAKRCISNFSKTEHGIILPGLDSEKLECTPIMMLNYVWLAIKHECKTEEDKFAIKENLIWTLFIIQKGEALSYDAPGMESPECDIAKLGLLVRVLCHEDKSNETNLEYKAPMASSADICLSVKAHLDRTFKFHSSYAKILGETRENERKELVSNYKKRKKASITTQIQYDCRELIFSGALAKDKLQEIIDASIDAWEPEYVENLQVSSP